jgi:hypothetical protein
VKPSISNPGAVRLIALLAVGVACGSSMGGGIAGTSSVLGAISGFGSIVVAGIAFDTTRAAITIEGDPVDESALKLGMVAAVRGAVDGRTRRGVAEVVAVEDLAEGPLDAVDAPAASLLLLGQQVLSDAATVFDPVPLAELAPDDDVEVSGFLDASGRIRATRVERKLEDVEIELKGFIQELDASRATFRIGGVLVDFSDAIIEGAPTTGLAGGLFVEVEAEERPVGGVLAAIGVEVLDPTLMAEVGDGLEVQGFVTAITSATDFVLNGAQRVRITADTRFEGGGASDLALDRFVEAEGVADQAGVLIATEIEFSRGP